MNILLDTHVWLWMRAEPMRLSKVSRELIENERNVLLFSAASAWEIALKVRIGKLTLPIPVDEFLESRTALTRVSPMPITQLHAVESTRFRFHHRDPFDRILAAQARTHDVPLLTADPIFKRYGVKTLKAT